MKGIAKRKIIVSRLLNAFVVIFVTYVLSLFVLQEGHHMPVTQNPVRQRITESSHKGNPPLNVNASHTASKAAYLSIGFRTPLAILEDPRILELYKGKIYGEVGAAYGDLLQVAAKHAKRVFALEARWERVVHLRNKGYKVYEGDVTEMSDIPFANLYYIFLEGGFAPVCHIVRRLPSKAAILLGMLTDLPDQPALWDVAPLPDHSNIGRLSRYGHEYLKRATGFTFEAIGIPYDERTVYDSVEFQGYRNSHKSKVITSDGRAVVMGYPKHGYFNCFLKRAGTPKAIDFNMNLCGNLSKRIWRRPKSSKIASVSRKHKAVAVL